MPISEWITGKEVEPSGRLARTLADRHQIIGEMLDPDIEWRGSLLPVGRTQSGGFSWAVPQFLIDAAKSAMLPGDAARGVPYSDADVTQMALDVGMGGGASAAAFPSGGLGMNSLRKGARRVANDLPMDEASRMARAREMGYDTDVYHATTADITEFKPGWRGSNYFAQTPDGAHRGALFGRLDNVSGTTGPSNPTNVTMPLKVRSQDIKGLSVSKDAWDSLPDVILNDDDLAKYVSKIKDTGATYWGDLYESVLQKDGSYKYYKRDAPTIKYQDINGRDVFGYMLPGFNTGSDVDALRYYADKFGKKGFLVSDESGAAIVGGPDLKIRSRFAAFDPAKADSADLLAANASAAPGLMQERRRVSPLAAMLLGDGLSVGEVY